MNKVIVFLIVFLFTTLLLSSQDLDNIKPIGLDKSALSGVGLDKIDLEDEPEKDFYQRRLYWGQELGVFVVGTQSWVNKVSNYPFDEFVYMYNGEAIVKPVQGASQIFYSGDYFFAPKGFSGEWEIVGNDNIHYELSVITTSRVDSSKIIANSSHKLFGKAMLSGNTIDLNSESYSEETLEKGAELTIKLVGEKPGERAIDATTKEQLILLLAGQVEIATSSEDVVTYYSGDSFILPKGLTGKWRNEGHNLIKYISVEKTRSQ